MGSPGPNRTPQIQKSREQLLVCPEQAGIWFVGPDQKMVTKRPSNWSPGLILNAFCTIFRARPVGTGLGAKFGRKPAKNQLKIIILITYSPEGPEIEKPVPQNAGGPSV